MFYLILNLNKKIKAPYYCAEASLSISTTACSSISSAINLPSIFQQVTTYESRGLIDNTINLKNHRVYLYGSNLDFVVRNCKI